MGGKTQKSVWDTEEVSNVYEQSFACRVWSSKGSLVTLGVLCCEHTHLALPLHRSKLSGAPPPGHLGQCLAYGGECRPGLEEGRWTQKHSEDRNVAKSVTLS